MDLAQSPAKTNEVGGLAHFLYEWHIVSINSPKVMNTVS
jgi:hypothetical protein